MLLRRAFTELLAQKPLRRISVKELCEQAGINRSTFYAHYEDAYDLHAQLEAEMLAAFEQALAPLRESGRQDLPPAQVSEAVFACLRENADLCTVALGEHGDKHFAERLIGLGRELCTETYALWFREASPRKIACFYAFASAGCIGLLRQWLADGMTMSAHELATTAERLMFEGAGFLRGVQD